MNIKDCSIASVAFVGTALIAVVAKNPVALRTVYQAMKTNPRLFIRENVDVGYFASRFLKNTLNPPYSQTHNEPIADQRTEPQAAHAIAHDAGQSLDQTA